MTYRCRWRYNDNNKKAVEIVFEGEYIVRVIEDIEGAWYPVKESLPQPDRKKADATFRRYVRKYL